MQHYLHMAAVLGALVMGAGCTLTPPTAPSVIPTVDLTVRVGVRGTEAPLAGATVTIAAPSFSASAVTNVAGELVVTVPMGDVDVTAAANGFASMTASGTVRSAERWTFFLEAR